MCWVSGGWIRKHTKAGRFYSLFAFPHSHICSIKGIRESPLGVREYSTLGETCGYSLRSMSPLASSSLRAELRALQMASASVT